MRWATISASRQSTYLFSPQSSSSLIEHVARMLNFQAGLRGDRKVIALNISQSIAHLLISHIREWNNSRCVVIPSFSSQFFQRRLLSDGISPESSLPAQAAQYSLQLVVRRNRDLRPMLRYSF